MITEALGTAVIMRFFIRACRNCFSLPLICGSPSDCLNSSFISCSDIFCRSYHCRYWKKKSAIATTASIATTAPSSFSVRLVVTPNSADGSKRSIDSSRSRSGHRIAIITAPSAITLNRPLAKFAAACLPKIRLAPAAGETLLNFGFSDSPDHTRRCCTMLPAIAASASIKSGTPSVAISIYSSDCASSSRPGPSAWIIQELAIRLRSGIRIPPPIEPENVDNVRVAPAITNQVLISWLLATSPRSWASSRRFCVGSCVLSAVSFSSAMASSGFRLNRYQLMHDADEIIQVSAHHRRQHQAEDQEAGEDRERHADEIDLHLRDQPYQHATPDIEDQAEHQEWRRKLHADLERGGKGAGGRRCAIAARQRLIRRKHRVAVAERGDHQMVAVGCKQQRDAEHGEEISDQQALLALRRIDRGNESEPELLGDHRSGHLQGRKRHPRGGAEHHADDDLMQHQHQERRHRLHVDVVGVAVQRQYDQRQHQRDRKLDTNRDVALAQSRQQHDHRSDAGEYQHEGGREHRQH